MSGIASLLVQMGHQVSGSDWVYAEVLDRLARAGVDIQVGHDPAMACAADAVTFSSAVPVSNPELVAAARQGVPVLRRAEMLGAICGGKTTVAVSGTHGKTTTSAMLSLALVGAGWSPSYLVGGEVAQLSGAGAHWESSGSWFVVEADESDGTFLSLGAHAVLVTSVEADHLDFYGGMEALVDAFERFVSGAGGHRLVCADDRGAARLAKVCPGGAQTYGLAADASFSVGDLDLSPSGSSFVLRHQGRRIGRVELAIPGVHVVRNAAGALGMALDLGAPFGEAARALGDYRGAARRFQRRGEHEGVTYIDDYAHLPSEISANLAAARVGRWQRVVAVFQPHRYSRTQQLFGDFAHAFAEADLVVVCDVYPAGEAPIPGVSGELIARAISEADPAAAVHYVPERASLAAAVSALVAPGDLCLTMGAGDITRLADEIRRLPARDRGKTEASPAERCQEQR